MESESLVFVQAGSELFIYFETESGTKSSFIFETESGTESNLHLEADPVYSSKMCLLYSGMLRLET